MSCLFNHRWIYDFRLHHVYRKCQFCDAAQRHVRNREAAYIDWESISERSNIESGQRRLVRKRTPGLARLAHSLGLLGIETSDWTRY